METTSILLLSIVIFLAAILYSSVGHGGASAYLAAMAMFGLSPSIMKPTALILNILVSAIGTVMYCRADLFSWRAFWPFTLGSIPLAMWGSTLAIPHLVYKLILGAILIFTGGWLFFKKNKKNTVVKQGPVFLQIIIGTAIGFVAGITGIGGGVILSPLLILTCWADTKKTSGVAAAFILVNSIAGIIGHLSVFSMPPGFIWYFVAAAVSGGVIGSTLGSKHLGGPAIKKVLGAVLILAGAQLLLVPAYKFYKKVLIKRA